MNTTDNVTMVEENSTPSFSHNTLSHASLQIIGFLLYSVSFVAFITNLLVIYLFLKNGKLRVPENVFIISVAVGDILLACIIPLTATSSILEEWRTDGTGCKAAAFIVYFIGMSNIYNITAMAIQRYLIITKPAHPSLKNLKPTMIALVASWSVGLLWAVTPFTGLDSYGFEGVNVSCGLDWDRNDTAAQVYTILLFVLGFLFPAGIIIFSYTAIYIKVAPSSASRLGVVRSSIERKTGVVKVAFCITCSFFVAWTPYAIVSFWRVFGNGEEIPELVKFAPALFAKCACLWNPFVYAGTHVHFREAFIKMLPCNTIDYASVRQSDGPAMEMCSVASRNIRGLESDTNLQYEKHLTRNASPASCNMAAIAEKATQSDNEEQR